MCCRNVVNCLHLFWWLASSSGQSLNILNTPCGVTSRSNSSLWNTSVPNGCRFGADTSVLPINTEHLTLASPPRVVHEPAWNLCSLFTVTLSCRWLLPSGSTITLLLESHPKHSVHNQIQHWLKAFQIALFLFHYVQAEHLQLITSALKLPLLCRYSISERSPAGYRVAWAVFIIR